MSALHEFTKESFNGEKQIVHVYFLCPKDLDLVHNKLKTPYGINIPCGTKNSGI